MGHSLCNPCNRDVIKVSWEQKKEQLTFGGIPEGIAEVMLSSSTSYQSFPGDSRAVAERSTEEIPGTRKNMRKKTHGGLPQLGEVLILMGPGMRLGQGGVGWAHSASLRSNSSFVDHCTHLFVFYLILGGELHPLVIAPREWANCALHLPGEFTCSAPPGIRTGALLLPQETAILFLKISS